MEKRETKTNRGIKASSGSVKRTEKMRSEGEHNQEEKKKRKSSTSVDV